MKNVVISISVAVFVIALVVAYLLFGSATAFKENKKYLFVYTGKADETSVMNFIEKNDLLKNPSIFKLLANKTHVWDKLKPGRFEIKKGENLISITRMLRNNRQSAVNLVINKLRTNEDVAGIIAKNFEADSAEVISYINSSDSLAKLDVDTNTLMTLIIPNTYTLYWNTPPDRIFKRLKSEKENFWEKKDRTTRAKNLGFTPTQIYTIASIVEEETNKDDEKGDVASVYINRYRAGMPLGADPTIKFALKDFGLKRIYRKYLDVQSPFNTYRNTGLPPGPICTPSAKTIDAVLSSPKTNYMYFVAKSDFSGYHTFSSNYNEHLKRAREYQKALDTLILRKQNAAKAAL
ncbi:endolytic transglycosylase MltG [Segetibacter koreensis]|uniref:endolytic transglycosylase MltG n=1 Tax=Segetibacter koreensis TaxID=398037 RepID=UPI000377D383|nr:endolytic transglycosylase MltG [Segetibacter koreensis]